MNDINVQIKRFNPASVFDVIDAIRVCRKSQKRSDSDKEANKLGDKDILLLQQCIRKNHTSVLEMCDISFIFDISNVAHKQLIRHRISSFQAESQRSVKPEFFYTPDAFLKSKEETNLYESMVSASFMNFLELIDRGHSLEDARYVLSQAYGGLIIYKTNIRSLRNAIAERTCKYANEEIRKIFTQIKKLVTELCPTFMYRVEKFYTCDERCGACL